MTRCFCEHNILNAFDPYCIATARRWLDRNNFALSPALWEDALQCARLGLLLYIRKNGIERAEDVFRDGRSPYWCIVAELHAGIVMEACAPCGIKRTQKTTHFKATGVQLETVDDDQRYSISDEDSRIYIMMAMGFIASLPEDDRRVVELLRLGLKGVEVQKRLGLTVRQYDAAMKRIRRRWKKTRGDE